MPHSQDVKRSRLLCSHIPMSHMSGSLQTAQSCAMSLCVSGAQVMAAADGGRRVRRVDPADPSQWNLSSMRALCGPASSASQRSAAQAAGVSSQARTAAGASSSRAMTALPSDAAHPGSGVDSAAGESSSWAMSAGPAGSACIGSGTCGDGGVSSSGALAVLAAGTACGATRAHGSRAGAALAEALPAPGACSDAILSGNAAPPGSDAAMPSAGRDETQAAWPRNSLGPAASDLGRHVALPELQLQAGSRGQVSTDKGLAAVGPAGAGAAGGAPDTDFWVDPYVGGFALRPRARDGLSCSRMLAPAAATEAGCDALQADSAPRQRTGAPATAPLVAKLEQEPARRAAVGFNDGGAPDISQLFEGMEDGEDF